MRCRPRCRSHRPCHWHVAVFPIVGAVLGGLPLTHLLWVTGTYAFLDSVLKVQWPSG